MDRQHQVRELLELELHTKLKLGDQNESQLHSNSSSILAIDTRPAAVHLLYTNPDLMGLKHLLQQYLLKVIQTEAWQGSLSNIPAAII